MLFPPLRRLSLATVLLAAGCATPRPAPPPPPPPAAPPVIILSPPPEPVPPPAPRPKPKPPARRPARPAAPKGDPVAAGKARAAGLAALSRGDVAAALPLFRRAAALDPGDPLIRRDLARAETAAARDR